jgi:hypothetical protein
VAAKVHRLRIELNIVRLKCHGEAEKQDKRLLVLQDPGTGRTRRRKFRENDDAHAVVQQQYVIELCHCALKQALI